MFFIEISSLKIRPIKTLRLIDSDKVLIGKTDFNLFPLNCDVRYTMCTVGENIKCYYLKQLKDDQKFMFETDRKEHK